MHITNHLETSRLYESLAYANKKLKYAYERLKVPAAMEKEFINIATHEPRIGYAEVLSKFPDLNKKQRCNFSECQKIL
jgi:hypothetical protein